MTAVHPELVRSPTAAGLAPPASRWVPALGLGVTATYALGLLLASLYFLSARAFWQGPTVFVLCELALIVMSLVAAGSAALHAVQAARAHLLGRQPAPDALRLVLMWTLAAFTIALMQVTFAVAGAITNGCIR